MKKRILSSILVLSIILMMSSIYFVKAETTDDIIISDCDTVSGWIG